MAPRSFKSRQMTLIRKFVIIFNSSVKVDRLNISKNILPSYSSPATIKRTWPILSTIKPIPHISLILMIGQNTVYSRHSSSIDRNISRFSIGRHIVVMHIVEEKILLYNTIKTIFRRFLIKAIEIFLPHLIYQYTDDYMKFLFKIVFQYHNSYESKS